MTLSWSKHYLWWIPTLFAYYFIYYWMSIKVNKSTLDWHQDPWFLWMFIFGAICPLWLIVSKVSKNLFIDGIIYDQIMLVSYYFTMIYLGQGARLTALQWGGVALLFIGGALVRVGSPS